jgi:hypothetical protein
MTRPRTLEGQCIGCGIALIWPFNEYHACTQCTKVIAKAVYETKMRKRDKTKGKVIMPRTLAVSGSPMTKVAL